MRNQDADIGNPFAIPEDLHRAVQAYLEAGQPTSRIATHFELDEADICAFREVLIRGGWFRS